MLLLCVLLALAPRAAAAQAPVPQTGVHYYALENLTTGRIEQRGVTGNNGVAHDNLILAPNSVYRHHLVQAATLWTGVARFETPASGSRISLPTFLVAPSSFPDSDGDGLPDDGELTIGTDQSNPDTDGDGVNDGAEVRQGTNPLDGLPGRTGIIATADTTGMAVDVAAQNDVVVVADSAEGVSVFNVFNGMNPVLIAQVDTPGSAERVAADGRWIAVADGGRGLAVIDMADPPNVAVVHQVPLNAPAGAVAVAAGVAYAGLESGEIVAVDLVSGAIVGRIGAAATVHDLSIAGDELYALTARELAAYGLLPDLRLLSRTPTSTLIPEGITGRKRLFVGGGIAYATAYPGFDTFDVNTPSSIARIAVPVDSGPNSFKQLVANGSGLGIGAVGVNPRNDGTHDVYLYDVSDPAVTDAFLTLFATPGLTRALSIYNGLAYVADSERGLQVVNYLPYDTMKVPPAIALTTSLQNGIAESGAFFRVSAAVSDDVQVRNVEIYVDGVLVATDGNFPFEQRLRAPRLADQSFFTLSARASDTGGNFAVTSELTFTLVPDATPPVVLGTAPRDGAVTTDLTAVAAFFSEAINAATLNASSFRLAEAGPDGALDTADDVSVTGAIELRPDSFAAFLVPSAELAAGRYRARIEASVADAAGNALAAPAIWRFSVFDIGEDRDADGVPDGLEEFLGLDPDDPDSDGDGVSDGMEDFDADGLTNFGEVLLGTDPINPDSNNNGILDGAEDEDVDGLTSAQEVARGTDARVADTDGDGWPDGAEVQVGSDPLSRSSQPVLTIVAPPPIAMTALSSTPPEGFRVNAVIGTPPVGIVVPDPLVENPVAANVTVGRPPVAVTVE